MQVKHALLLIRSARLRPARRDCGAAFFAERKMVGVTGVEPVTLRLSSACSNQLSYTPAVALRAMRAVPLGLPAGALAERRRLAASRSSPQRSKAGGAEETRTPDL
jgi:hypothetical protein